MMQLLELKKWYLLYEDFWPEWKDYKFNGLNEKEVLAIEIYKGNNFVIDISKLEMFYNSEKILEHLVSPLVKTLRENYSEYKEWVVNKFRFYLMGKAREIGWGQFFESKIETLPLSLNIILKLFNCSTVVEIFHTYDESPFMTQDHFLSLRDFYMSQDSEQEGWDYFFDLPLETLPLDVNHAIILKSLNCNTFQEVLDNFGKSEFHKKEIFKKVLKFKTIIREEEMKNKNFILQEIS